MARNFKLKIVILSVTLISFFANGVAQSPDSSSSSNVSKGYLERIQTPSLPKKHRAPSNVFLEYEYTGDGFFLYPSDLYESVTLTVEDVTCDSSWSDTLSESNGYFLETGPLHGVYTITAIADNGITYMGELTVD